MLNYGIAGLGFLIILIRLHGWSQKGFSQAQHKKKSSQMTPKDLPLLTVIIPARNEANNLPKLLKSLNHNKSWLEVVVVDDESSDNTFELAKSYQAKVLQGEPLPDGWTGKNWACHQGVKLATGEYLLFVDADTTIDINLLENAYSHIVDSEIDLATSMPFHICPSFWEKGLSAFFALISISTNVFGTHRKSRLFSIGQFLLFEREYYKRSGGHAYVRSVLAEDLFLARRCLSLMGNYHVFKDPIFKVRMYDTFGAFVKGWVRNFRLGLKFSSLWSPLEITFCFYALCGGGLFFSTLPSTVLSLASLLLVHFSMRHFGLFPVWSLFLTPLALLLFVVITIVALVQQVLSWPIQWRGRTYMLEDVILSE